MAASKRAFDALKLQAAVQEYHKHSGVKGIHAAT